MLKGPLNDLLLKNVVTLQYQKQDGTVREIFCTKAPELLLSFEGKSLLGFWQPKNSPRYNIDATDNILVWDLDARDYRTVNASRVRYYVNKMSAKTYRKLLINDKLKR